MTIQEFLSTTYHENPVGRVRLRDAHRAYLATLTERERKLYPLWRFREIAAEAYAVGLDSSRIPYIGGISTEPPATWMVDDAGRLRLQTI